MNPKMPEQSKCVPGTQGHDVYFGDLMLAKTFHDPKTGDAVADPIGMWASEKLDGYRCLWTGARFQTRSGKPIHAPISFMNLMPPSVALDGELYLGRGTFESLGFIRRKTPDPELWSRLKFHVFDIPSMMSAPFEKRMKRLGTVVRNRCIQCAFNKKECPLVFVRQILVESEKQLYDFMDTIINARGEGVMLRAAGSVYQPKRTSTLLKIKAEFDAECVIVGHKPGKGKYKGQLGSYKCEFLDGTGPFFVAGITDEMRADPLTVGRIITIRYNGLTVKALPRHPRFVRARDDLDF